MRAMENIQDLIEEAKIRTVWWAICVFGLAYLLSHTSKATWANIPVAFLIFCLLRIITYEVDFHWKVRPIHQQTYFSHLHQKQLRLDDPRLASPSRASNWKQKIDSPLAEAAIDDFINKILQDFVIDLWYSSITPDKEATEHIRAIVYDALAEVCGRIKDINLVELLTRDVIELIGNHIDLYRRNQAAIGIDLIGTLSFDERDEKLKQHLTASRELHPALISPEYEYKVLQRLMGGVLSVVMRSSEGPLVHCIARELLTCLVIQPVMNFACPGYVNEFIECIFMGIKSCTNKDNNHDNSVDTRIHWDGQSVEEFVQSSSLHQKGQGDMKFVKSGNPAAIQDIEHQSADWARKLEAATQRRSQVLAPENLENMWSKGRNYKKRSGPHIARGALVGSKRIQASVKGRLDLSACAQDLHKQSSSASGLIFPEMAGSGRANLTPLKRSSSSPALENQPFLGKEDTGKTDEDLSLKEVSSMCSDTPKDRPCSRSGSDTALQIDESMHAPKIKCRVLGAYFEKIGSKSFAVYSIAVTDADNMTWFVKRRYRNFERLHRHLKDIPNYTLHLPPKRFLSSSIDDHFVHQRCVLLDKYLQDLLSVANIAEQHEVWDFLSASSKNYSFGKSGSVMKSLAVSVDDAVDDIVRQFKGVSDGFLRKVSGSSLSCTTAQVADRTLTLTWNEEEANKHSPHCVNIGSSHSLSDDDEQDVKEKTQDEILNGWHSDNELKIKCFIPYAVNNLDEPRGLPDDKQQQAEEFGRLGFHEPVTNSSFTSDPFEDSVGVPSEWTPPNVSVPLLNLVDNIFQLNRRGWLRRQVFWISKQILQLMMEDAIDDWLLRQIHWLRRDDVVAQGIRWVMDILWPGGTFFLKLEFSSKDDGQSGQVPAPKANRVVGDGVPRPGSFDTQLEATRKANVVKKMLLGGAPTALVSLIGQKQYSRCARDIYFFLQSTVCLKQLSYCMLDLILITVFPELRDLVRDIHEKVHHQPA